MQEKIFGYMRVRELAYFILDFSERHGYDNYIMIHSNDRQVITIDCTDSIPELPIWTRSARVKSVMFDKYSNQIDIYI